MMVDFRFSDTDFSTYLILNGFSPTDIEVTYNKRINKLKAFIHFAGEKDLFLKLQNEYKNQIILVNPREFSKIRKELNNQIKVKLNEFRNTNRDMSKI